MTGRQFRSKNEVLSFLSGGGDKLILLLLAAECIDRLSRNVPTD